MQFDKQNRKKPKQDELLKIKIEWNFQNIHMNKTKKNKKICQKQAYKVSWARCPQKFRPGPFWARPDAHPWCKYMLVVMWLMCLFLLFPLILRVQWVVVYTDFNEKCTDVQIWTDLYMSTDVLICDIRCIQCVYILMYRFVLICTWVD